MQGVLSWYLSSAPPWYFIFCSASHPKQHGMKIEQQKNLAIVFVFRISRYTYLCVYQSLRIDVKISGEFTYITSESGNNTIIYYCSRPIPQLSIWIPHLFVYQTPMIDRHIKKYVPITWLLFLPFDFLGMESRLWISHEEPSEALLSLVLLPLVNTS